jgi:hypothetical protein
MSSTTDDRLEWELPHLRETFELIVRLQNQKASETGRFNAFVGISYCIEEADTCFYSPQAKTRARVVAVRYPLPPKVNETD